MFRAPLAHRIAPAFAFLLLTAAGGAAADQVAACTDQAAAPTAQVGLTPAPVLMQRSGENDTVSAQSSCTAECWDGSVLECSGTSCTAQDSVCSNGERGYCTSGPLRQECPPCPDPSCSATANCDNGGTATCSGYNNCFAVHGCYAYCEEEDDNPGDGFYVWCHGESPSTCPLP